MDNSKKEGERGTTLQIHELSRAPLRPTCSATEKKTTTKNLSGIGKKRRQKENREHPFLIRMPKN